MFLLAQNVIEAFGATCGWPENIAGRACTSGWDCWVAPWPPPEHPETRVVMAATGLLRLQSHRGTDPEAVTQRDDVDVQQMSRCVGWSWVGTDMSLSEAAALLALLMSLHNFDAETGFTDTWMTSYGDDAWGLVSAGAADVLLCAGRFLNLVVGEYRPSGSNGYCVLEGRQHQWWFRSDVWEVARKHVPIHGPRRPVR